MASARYALLWLAASGTTRGSGSTSLHNACTDEAACRCLLGCNIFGGKPSKCRKTDNKRIVDLAVYAATQHNASKAMCEGTQCILKCSQGMGCVDKAVVKKCEDVKHKDASCHLDCHTRLHYSSAPGMRRPSASALLAVAASIHMLSHR
mmetsp:Transcript_64755/g.150556  ORF Transcript_64755/g.150556 Transcript_64755/m.150556 type:complete len:149 (+) Transcript_64755:99-545(+)